MTRRIVLRDNVTIDDIDDLVWQYDWRPIEVGDRDSDTWTDIWSSEDGCTEISYTEDRPIGMRYMIVQGNDRKTTEEQIEATLATWTAADALAFAEGATGRDEKLTAIYAMALSAHPDKAGIVVDKLSTMAHDEDVRVRQAIVIATGYVEWPTLIDTVRYMYQNDGSSIVRKTSEILLRGLQQYGGRS